MNIPQSKDEKRISLEETKEMQHIILGILKAIDKVCREHNLPTFGICLGMQLLLESGLENGQSSGLGLIPGVCRRIPDQAGLPVPHMGWNDLQIRQTSALTAGLEGQSVYFVHSYYTDVSEEYLDVTADYGRPIPAMIHRGTVFGCQFHPEKSGAVGLGILEKFKEYVYENTARY